MGANTASRRGGGKAGGSFGGHGAKGLRGVGDYGMQNSMQAL